MDGVDNAAYWTTLKGKIKGRINVVFYLPFAVYLDACALLYR